MTERWRYPRFFTDNISDDTAVVSGEDVKHITSVLRMRKGSPAVLCDGRRTDYLAELDEVTGDRCTFRVLEKSANEAEPSIYLRLFLEFSRVSAFFMRRFEPQFYCFSFYSRYAKYSRHI